MHIYPKIHCKVTQIYQKRGSLIFDELDLHWDLPVDCFNLLFLTQIVCFLHSFYPCHTASTCSLWFIDLLQAMGQEVDGSVLLLGLLRREWGNPAIGWWTYFVIMVISAGTAVCLWRARFTMMNLVYDLLMRVAAWIPRRSGLALAVVVGLGFFLFVVNRLNSTIKQGEFLSVDLTLFLLWITGSIGCFWTGVTLGFQFVNRNSQSPQGSGVNKGKRSKRKAPQSFLGFLSRKWALRDFRSIQMENFNRQILMERLFANTGKIAKRLAGPGGNPPQILQTRAHRNTLLKGALGRGWVLHGKQGVCGFFLVFWGFGCSQFFLSL